MTCLCDIERFTKETKVKSVHWMKINPLLQYPSKNMYAKGKGQTRKHLSV